jgi:hypothetical protein
VRINRLAGARYAVSIASRLTLEAGATRSRGHDAAVATSELSSDELNGAVRFALGPQLTLSGIYSYLRSEQEVAPPTRSDRAMLQLSYARAWR